MPRHEGQMLKDLASQYKNSSWDAQELHITPSAIEQHKQQARALE